MKRKLRELLAEHTEYPSYNTIYRMAQRGEITLYQFGGSGPLYVDELDLADLWQPVTRFDLERDAGPNERLTTAVPSRRRCQDCNRISIDGVHCSDHKRERPPS